MQDFQPIPGLSGRIFPIPDPSPSRRHHHHRHHHTTTTISDHSPLPPTKCPRCDSTNTKFCYYNNYNLSQPRHFCKSCRRYWTKGGVLRNVPIGGGCRKNSKKSKPAKPASKPAIASGSSSESCSNNTTTATVPDPDPKPNVNPLPEVVTTTFEPAAGFSYTDPGLFVDPAGFSGSVVDSGSLFDITSSVDPAVYWNQGNWGDDTDPSSLYLP